MITASHNPGEDNGFKVVHGKSTIHGAEIQKLRTRIETRSYRLGGPAGTTSDHYDIIPGDYVDYIVDNIKLGPRRFKIVVDGGNGTGGLGDPPHPNKLGPRRRGPVLRARRQLPEPPP